MKPNLQTATFAGGPARYAKATFAGGCFWCTEAIFSRLKGVLKVIPGYSGGNIKNPTYEQVSAGSTGHAEAIQITYNPKEISYEDLLYIFWKTHDPTTLNRQGNDVGKEYRSIIFYHSPQQKMKVLKSKKIAQKVFRSPIVTEIIPYTNFYQAEGYHLKYYNKNPNATYCRLVIDPKIEKLKREFGKYLA